jgi:iron-sulfur cluster repair protein YtfE (RIC family)
MTARLAWSGGGATRVWRVIALALVLSGCNEEEHKKQLAELQAKADKRIQDIEGQAKDRVASLEKQLETLKTEVTSELEKAKAEANEATSKAQASVDDAAKETALALDRARAAYKGEGKARYQALNNDLAEVTAKARKVPAKAKDAYDKAIKNVLALQKDITKDLSAYDDATLDTFAKTKGKLDTDLAKYKAAITSAKNKVPRD